MATAVEHATALFQYALTTKFGGECIALQALTNLDDRATVLSIDGIGAFDLIMRCWMVCDRPTVVIQCSLLFCNSVGIVLFWTDDLWRDSRDFATGWAEQGDPLMPMLYSLGQHLALLSVRSHLREGEGLFAFLDEVYLVSQPERTGDLHEELRDALWGIRIIQIHNGNIQIWNGGRFEPPAHAALLQSARLEEPGAQIWFGDLDAPDEARGIRVLGTPLGPLLTGTGCSLTEFQRFRECSQRCSFFSFALLHGQRFTFVCAGLP